MAKCGVTTCDNRAIAGFEQADVNKSVIRWCKIHEADLCSKAYGPGRRLTQEQVDNGLTLQQTLIMYNQWLQEYISPPGASFAFVCWTYDLFYIILFN